MAKESEQGLARRDLLRLAAIGGAAVAAGVGRSEGATHAEAAPQAEGRESVAPFALEEATIADLQAKMSSGELTARQIAEAYLERIERLDRSGPKLASILETNPEALAIADGLDKERREKGARGPMHGIPVLLKDNIGTGDRMETTAGSLALVGAPKAQDAHLVTLLRTSGAVILGKTNLSEWANFRSTRSSSGWSGRGGQTRNPYVLDRSPCGSSAGSGTAIAANLAAVAVGTETDGSIVCPATTNGMVGIKPTLGLVSRSGIIPIAASQDTAGPMARTVRDAAVLLSALAGEDPSDTPTILSRGRSKADYSEFVSSGDLRGVRLGAARNQFGSHERVLKAMDEGIAALRGLGAEVIDMELPNAGKYDDSEFEVLLWEFKDGLNRYLAARGMPAGTRTLEELIAWNVANRERELQYFGQEIFERAQKKTALTDKEYKKALASNQLLSREKGIDEALRKNKLDALIASTGGPSWPTDLVCGDHYTGGFSTASAVAGYPHVTVPAGSIFGLPVGISFFSTAWSEPMLIRIASAYEHATRHRVPPKYLPTAELGA
jgi:amidase